MFTLRLNGYSAYDFRDELVVDDGLVFKGQRCVVPEAIRSEVLQRIHAAHIGREGCIRRAREHVYWPGMTAHIKDYVSRCETCLKFSRTQQKETFYQPDTVPSRPWQEIATDLCVIESQQYLVTVDYFSNFAEVDRLNKTGASEVILHLKKLFARYGSPEILRSDNGPQFSCGEFKGFAQKWNFKHVTSSPGYPQSNGKAENAVRTVKELVRRAWDSGADPWQALLDFRNTPSQGIAISPAQRLLGRRTRTTMVTHPTMLHPEWKSCTERQARQKATQRQVYNEGARDLVPLKTGDKVMIQLHPTDREWKKGVVIQCFGIRSYVVQTEKGKYRRNRRRLRPIPAEDLEVGETEESEDEAGFEEGPAPHEDIQEEEVPDEARQNEDPVTTRSGRISRRPRYLQDFVE